MEVRTLDGGTVALDRNALQAGLRLPLLAPGEPGFDDSVRLWNGMIRKRAALVVRPTGAADVLHALRFARERGLLISIKGGGHNIGGTAIADGGIVFDLSRMKGVHVDPRTRVARVQAGCLLGDVDRETAVHDLAAVLGFISETGVAGLTLGGGFGYLTRQHGYTVDNLVEVEIVTADGKVRRASRDEDADLFWALRGGGGNFGVVTSFAYALHPVPPRIVAGMVFWDAADAPAVLELLREWSASSPRTVTSALTIRNAPPAPFMPKEWHGKPVLGWVVCHVGADRERAFADLAPMRTIRKPIVDLIVDKTYRRSAALARRDAARRGPPTPGSPSTCPRLDGDLIPVALEQAKAVTSPMSAVIFFQMEGALSERKNGRRTPSGTATRDGCARRRALGPPTIRAARSTRRGCARPGRGCGRSRTEVRT
jgi:hypothetical protein